MNEKIKVLHICNAYDYSSGIRKHVKDLFRIFRNDTEYEFHLLTNHGNAVDELKYESRIYELTNFSTGLTGAFSILSLQKKIKEYCTKNNILIIHSHHRLPEFVVARIAKELNIKTVSTIHSFVKGFAKVSFKSDHLIAVSAAIKQYVIKKFQIEPEKVTKLYNFFESKNYLNISRNEIRKHLGLEGKKILLYAGRISRIKGSDLLIKSFRKILIENDNLVLVMVGDILEKEFEFLKFNTEENIYYFPAESEISRFLIDANIIILPSREDPFPYLMLESSVFETPFIGANTGGIAEFIRDGIDGFLFKPGNSESLLHKIDFVLNNDELAKACARKLRSKIDELLSAEKYKLNLKNVYINLLKK